MTPTPPDAARIARSLSEGERFQILYGFDHEPCDSQAIPKVMERLFEKGLAFESMWDRRQFYLTRLGEAVRLELLEILESS